MGATGLELGNIMILGICKVGRPGKKGPVQTGIGFLLQRMQGGNGPAKRWEYWPLLELPATHVPDIGGHETADRDRTWQRLD